MLYQNRGSHPGAGWCLGEKRWSLFRKACGYDPLSVVGECGEGLEWLLLVALILTWTWMWQWALKGCNVRSSMAVALTLPLNMCLAWFRHGLGQWLLSLPMIHPSLASFNMSF